MSSNPFLTKAQQKLAEANKKLKALLEGTANTDDSAILKQAAEVRTLAIAVMGILKLMAPLEKIESLNSILSLMQQANTVPITERRKARVLRKLQTKLTADQPFDRDTTRILTLTMIAYIASLQAEEEITEQQKATEAKKTGGKGAFKNWFNSSQKGRSNQSKANIATSAVNSAPLTNASLPITAQNYMQAVIRHIEISKLIGFSLTRIENEDDMRVSLRKSRKDNSLAHQIVSYLYAAADSDNVLSSADHKQKLLSFKDLLKSAPQDKVIKLLTRTIDAALEQIELHKAIIEFEETNTKVPIQKDEAFLQYIEYLAYRAEVVTAKLDSANDATAFSNELESVEYNLQQAIAGYPVEIATNKHHVIVEAEKTLQLLRDHKTKASASNLNTNNTVKVTIANNPQARQQRASSSSITANSEPNSPITTKRFLLWNKLNSRGTKSVPANVTQTFKTLIKLEQSNRTVVTDLLATYTPKKQPTSFMSALVDLGRHLENAQHSPIDPGAGFTTMKYERKPMFGKSTMLGFAIEMNGKPLVTAGSANSNGDIPVNLHEGQQTNWEAILAPLMLANEAKLCTITFGDTPTLEHAHSFMRALLNFYPELKDCKLVFAFKDEPTAKIMLQALNPTPEANSPFSNEEINLFREFCGLQVQGANLALSAENTAGGILNNKKMFANYKGLVEGTTNNLTTSSRRLAE